MAQEILDHTCSYDDMISFLRDHGNDPETFDARGRKTLEDLHKEITKERVALVWIEKYKRIFRFAYSVKLLIRTPRGYLLETARIYEKGPPLLNVRPWTVSGTMRRDETAITGIIREVKEELKIIVPFDEIVGYPPEPVPTIHQSSVYPDILSFVVMSKFLWTTNLALKAELIPDTNVQILLSYDYKIPPESEEDIIGEMLYKRLFSHLTF
jgi:hypothetical protein